MKLEAADFAALDDAQRSAFLEALVGMVTADGTVSAEESHRFDQVVRFYPWDVEREVMVAMIQGISDRIKAIKTPAQAHDFVAGIAARLPTPELRDKVFFTIAALAFADGSVNKAEVVTLELFQVAFGITSERLARIKAALTGQPMPSVAEPLGN
ncbi:MAG TPA: TerB family tellurite resistance protein [Kofleriaceae bacterium]|nr:TerB family tellurite resistance protein [Kofleriaceae bacterium]